MKQLETLLQQAPKKSKGLAIAIKVGVSSYIANAMQMVCIATQIAIARTARTTTQMKLLHTY